MAVQITDEERRAIQTLQRLATRRRSTSYWSAARSWPCSGDRWATSGGGMRGCEIVVNFKLTTSAEWAEWISERRTDMTTTAQATGFKAGDEVKSRYFGGIGKVISTECDADKGPLAKYGPWVKVECANPFADFMPSAAKTETQTIRAAELVKA